MPNSFWGKLSGARTTDIEWHPLQHHCADVAACVEALLTNTILGKRLAATAGLEELTAQQIARLATLAAWHDLGKFNIGFQNKASGNAPIAGHVRELACLFAHADSIASTALCQVLPIGELQTWAADDGALELLLAAVSHHGQPVDIRCPLPDFRIWRAENERGLAPFDGIARLVAATRTWFPSAFESTKQRLPDNAGFQHLFAGVVMLADWLGSDVRFFPFSDNLDDRIAFARNAASRALGHIGLDTRSAKRFLQSNPISFARSFQYEEPRDIQKRVKELTIGAGPSLAIVEAETGSGKTEAALWHYLRLFGLGLVDGIYFALPTRTAATQLYRRVSAIIERSFGDTSARPPVVLAVPGYISVDNVQGTKLPDFKVLWPDDKQDHLRFRGWAAESPKRYLAGSVVVGTIDQVLLSGLRVSHAHLRAASLTRLLLVVDEVHASDAYMATLLENVLAFQFSSRGHALLMSATLGQTALERYRRTIVPTASAPTLSEAKSVPFPSVHWDFNERFERCPAQQARPSKNITMEIAAIADEPRAIARVAVDAAGQEASVLIIRNTVADCRAVQQAIETMGSNAQALLLRCNGEMTAHHSRYARIDRQALDDAIEREFGKRRDRRGRIAVATQTVQQSLDLDADLLITDLCPVDVLLQRIGRLHRHERPNRPNAFAEPRCIVVTPSERILALRIQPDGEPRGDHGLGSVYDDLRALEATWRQLESRPIWHVPETNRELVENATHPEALKQIEEELGEKMQRHGQWIHGQVSMSRSIGKGHLLNCDDHFGSQKSLFPSRDVAGRIATRLGADDRTIEFLVPMAAAFGGEFRQLTVPGHMVAPNTPADETPGNLTRTHDGFEFTFGGRAYRYDRMGLHREE